MDSPTDAARFAAFDGVVGIGAASGGSSRKCERFTARAGHTASILMLISTARDGMGQRADGNKIDAGFGDRADGFEGDVAGGFENHALADDLARRGAFRRAACCRAGSRSAPCAIASATCASVSHSISMRKRVRREPPRAIHRGADRARRGDVVVLDQHAAIQAEAMIAAAADADRILLDGAQARMSFARIDDARAGAGDRVDEAARDVAMPDSSWTKLSATRSPVRSPASIAVDFGSNRRLVQAFAFGAQGRRCGFARRSARTRVRA